ncbi:hydrogenase maturation peptidase HycI [Methanococcus maripaludis]|uniref:Hydrogenase 3 maturation protease n=1 Tax=Methanococcus maripaludis TaxID=39152 RepID=A0A2L1CCE4_METMI|nr:hydrogenase maturation peptidase HycI [Methanococcus maripaludis]AVB77031.1 Hydrogenase 3 maturation protease [Methanococcus maripaludis]MBA2863543.1 hydrogenase 3 maturation protease [Methanococcus maripaludis]MBB6496452.1 hydrogenase 3 maturation protease [Methanococcus maripaludis]
MESVQGTIKSFINNSNKIAILGIGNYLKSDDGFGVYVVESLVKNYSKTHENLSLEKEINSVNNRLILMNCGVVPENFTDVIKRENPDKIIMVDAALMHQEPGTLRVVKSDEISETGFSTHSLPLSIIIKYINAHIDTEILIIGIEPTDLEFGEPLSGLIKEKADEFSKILIEEIDSFLL